MFHSVRPYYHAHSLSSCLRRGAKLSLATQPNQRTLLTLAIETSCDDTSVAVLERHDTETARQKHNGRRATLHFHEKVTSNNAVYKGVHPIVSLESHQENLAMLVQRALKHLPPIKETGAEGLHKHAIDTSAYDVAGTAIRAKPNFVSVTRGPGMRSNLFTGLDTAKGLAVAWGVPLVGVHHMQAHALTPRLVDALRDRRSGETQASNDDTYRKPDLPFMSLLVSGGHTLLIHSKALKEHTVLASTSDTAIGDCLDKVARAVIPTELLETAKGTMYGALLESFTFVSPSPISDVEYAYTAPTSLHESLIRRPHPQYGWTLSPPFAESPRGIRAEAMEFSFSGLCSNVEKIMQFTPDLQRPGHLTKISRGESEDTVSISERRALAQEAMRVAFEHLASRILLGLRAVKSSSDIPKTLVLSGGVAANSYLRHILRKFLAANGYAKLELVCPPPEYCTDNAAMIAWAGMEMFDAGERSSLSIRAIRKWPLDLLTEAPQDG